MTLRNLFTTIVCCATTFCAAQITMTIDATKRGPLTSPYQYGLFFEEINHAGDGGLYAEQVRNRSFDEGLDGWSKYTTVGASMTLTTTDLLNDVQRQALDIFVTSASAERMRGVRNEGFWGMNFVEGETYTLTCWAKADNDGFTGNLVARLLKSDGKTVIGEAALEGTVETAKWNKLTATIKATGTDAGGQLLLLTSNNGHLYLDVVSLFPQTWKGRANGLRPDLAQLLADTKPAFLRFPGGCYVEGEAYDGKTIENSFQWKNTIGPIEQRPGHLNRNWRYWSSDGLGFDEYLQLAEDMGAAPMFVVNVGLGHGWYVPMEDLDTLVQNTLDAIEYANGDGSTYWGARRIKNGHPAPYNLKFIEIGNENYNFNMSSNSDQSYDYPERYYRFYSAIKAKYPDIVTIGNVEAWGTDNPTWRNKYPVELVDEHYYRTSAWMRDNYHKYDNYPREPKVYVGEYAANSGSWGQYGNLNAALGEAIFMLGMEKNSDAVSMGSFAPIFTHEKDPAWAYDMIHFNAAQNFVTPSYHVQKMMGNNLGYQNLKWTETGNTVTAAAQHQVGVATWDTQASYDNVVVTANDLTVVADDFSANSGWNVNGGSWNVRDGVLRQTASGTNNDLGCRYVNQTKFSAADYILTLRARKDSGAEGFLVIFDYQDANNYAWWNIGGWGNTQNAIEICRNGSKSQYSTARFSVENGQWYDLKVEVIGSTIRCYVDGTLLHELTLDSEPAIYQSAQLSTDGKELILKVVNPNSTAQQLIVNAKNMTLGGGTVERLSSAKGTDENTMDEPDKVKPMKLSQYEQAFEHEFGQVDSDQNWGFVDQARRLAAADGLKLDIPAFSLNIYRLAVTDVADEIPQKTVADYPEYVEEDKDMAAYLYAHMHETGEYTCYALSTSGNDWNDLFGSQEVFDTKAYTKTGGMRDAYVCRLKSGNGFMLVGTDMTSRLGWTSNHIMDLMLSPDLIHWTKEVFIDLESEENLKALSKVYPDMDASKMTAAWAPQVIYDPQTKKYVLYYSVGFPDYHRTFYQLLDEELNILTEPRLYFDPGYDIIDDDIVWNAVDQQYVMFFKCESSNGFDRATATTLVPEEGATGTTVWTVTKGVHVGENNQAIEGMSQWRPIGDLRWRLAYINYSNGYVYRMRYMDEHCQNVDAAGHTISGSLRAQHGCVLKLKQQEYDFLLAWEQVKKLLPAVEAYHALRPTEQHAAAIKAAQDALNQTTTFAENYAAMKKAGELLAACQTDMRQIAIEEAVEKGYGDLTPLIENADFSKGGASWGRWPEFTQANGNVAEFWNTDFYMSQWLEGLPNGKYEVSVQSYYRFGSINNAARAHGNGTEELNAILFANDESLPIMSIFDSSTAENYTLSPYTYPDNVAQANQAFNTLGLYTNKLQTTVTDGTLNIGIYNYESVNSDWCCFDNFRLTYLGPDTRVSSVKQGTGRWPHDIYNLHGQRVSKPGKGVYIVGGKKMKRLNQ